ncbi:L-2-hydroxyglutarate oxidase [Aureimonas fodinaquatilis]|uniref:L-2-hydroxyglutarate oxidase n=1 Tax=Aureimonas fodinaquatilis TaxID=2565783 RepID=A0A5B0DSD8_9HYPH|nr:L-2-hydroxyglutarate oxidase [Aureimonas fodinaquatilis]KAA0968905.1 L-2-hydroxyglutarate oxidase [Aureimonas fodinaquatilis]
MPYQYCVVGGGIVGLATTLELLRRDPGAKIVLLEKEAEPGLHQTGHNSGVIHAGVYYQPGSLKARLCREGAEATKQFCSEHNIPFEVCGKLLVATNAQELERMHALEGRARENEIDFDVVSVQRLRELEPNISGVGAMLVHATGIVDYRRICLAMAALLTERGVEIRYNTRVSTIRETGQNVDVITDDGATLTASQLVACAGLQSDRLAKAAGMDVTHRIVPFRGEYYTLPQSKSGIVRHLIYPIPDPDLPFLGIHLTRMIDGSTTVGPNAVLGFAREGYPKGSVNVRDVVDTVRFGGFWKMAAANMRSGVTEFRNSIARARYLEECRKFCPSLKLEDLSSPGAGIRAQAVLADGTLVHDFLFLQSPRMLHVCNAPSPAATSAMPIGRMIVDRLTA